MYIIKTNSKTILGFSCYVRCRKNQMEEVIDPSAATPFAKKETAENWIRENAVSGDLRTTDLRKELDKFKKWADTGMVRRKLPLKNKRYSRKYDPDRDTPLDVLDWHIWQGYHDDEISFDDYQTWPSLYNLFHHLHGISRYEGVSGHSFTIYVSKSSEFKTFEQDMILALSKTTATQEGNVKFDIFDHILGEGGDFAYLVFPAGDIKSKSITVSGRFRDFHTGDLRSAFDYLRNNRYYGK